MHSGPPANSPPESDSSAPPSGRIIGKGEMADLVRAYDWASTPLGPIVTWSKELLTIVNLTLASPSPARTMWGPDFILIYNDAYCPIPGPRHPAALGKPAKSIYAESWHVVGPLLEKAFATGETFFYEKLLVPLPTKNGIRDFYLNYSFNPIFENGKIAGLFGPLQDVTGEVLATLRLRESEARASRILQSIGDAVIVTDAEACITQMNPIAEALTGWTAEEAKGRALSEVFHIVHESTRQPVESPADKVKRLGAIVGLANHTILIRRDGSETPIDDSGAPIRDDQDRLTGIVLVFRDINDRKLAEDALLQSEKLAAVGRLASSIAHEINNPLESVTNVLYLVRQMNVTPEVDHYLEIAERELRRVSTITNQTLRFHKQAAIPTEVRIEPLIETVLSLYQGRIINSGIQVERRDRAHKPIRCFEGEIRQVISNLVGNALDAMRPTGGRLLIRTREAHEERSAREGLLITVADTGPGMPAAIATQAFTPFFTTKGFSGTGLGLWISKEIIERHNGKLLLRSCQREGHIGTVLTIFLPFDAAIR